MFSGDVPLAQAHRNRLPEDAVGIEFYAFSAPDKLYGAPEWRSPKIDDSGKQLVFIEDDATLGEVVKVKVAITRVTQAF